MNSGAKTTTVYGEAVDESNGMTIRVLGVWGQTHATQDKRFVSIELRAVSGFVRNVDCNPRQLEQLVGALERACKAETR